MWSKFQNSKVRHKTNIFSFTTMKPHESKYGVTFRNKVNRNYVWWMCDHSMQLYLLEQVRNLWGTNSLVTQISVDSQVHHNVYSFLFFLKMWASSFLCCLLIHLTYNFKLARERLCFDFVQAKVISDVASR